MIEPHVALALSVFFVCAGPALAWLVERWVRLRAGLDGFVLVTVAGICLVFLLPHAWESLGAWALLLAALGLLLPAMAERGLDDHGGRASHAVLGLAMAGLLLHTFIDGVALGSNGTEHDHHFGDPGGLEMTLAILLHRLPVGLLIWTTIRPWLGRKGAWAVLGGVVLATGGGFAAGGALEALAEARGAGILDALLAGGLLHVVIDEHHTARATGSFGQAPAAIGALLGLALFALLPLHFPEFLRAAWHAGVGLFCESALPVLLGFAAAGFLSLVPTAVMARLMTGKTAAGSALRGVIFGLPIPICSCGVVPIYSGLMRKGVPAAAAIAFLVATPELGVDAVALSLPLLGWELTLVRLGAAIALAATAGIAVHLLLRGKPLAPPPPAGCEDDESGAGHPVVRALRYGFVDAFDDLGPWILAGVAVAAVMQPLLDPQWIQSLPAATQIPLFTGVATPFYVCASAATPMAAVLLAKGVQAGAVIAFLLAGPATNVTTYGAIRLFHGRGTTVAALGVIVATCIALGVLVNLLPLDTTVWAANGGHEIATWQGVAGVAFCVLLLTSLARQGPRGFLRRLGLAHGHGEAKGAVEDDCCADAECGSEPSKPSVAEGGCCSEPSPCAEATVPAVVEAHDHGHEEPGHDHDPCCH